MTDKVTPEERLLRLIRGQKKEGTPLKKERIPLKEFYLSLIKRHISILSAKKLIKFSFILACAYLIFTLAYPLFAFRKVAVSKTTGPVEDEDAALPEVKPYEFYLKGIKEKQIFGSASASSEAKPSGSIDVDITRNINLVGIISGDNPQAIIEDKKSQKTYYVTKGQFISDIRVDDIQEGKIIVNYRGRRYELFL